MTVLIKQHYCWRLTGYVQSSEEEFLKAVRREGVENHEMAASFKDRRRTEKYPRMERDAIIQAVCKTEGSRSKKQ